MKDVALMTCFLDNYGACLQAYALSRTINELGNKCTIINYIEPQGYFAKSLTNFIKDSSLYNIIRCITNRKYRESYKFDKIRRKSFKNFRKRFLPLSEEYKAYEELKQIRGYDAYVCGSDQVWNPTFYGRCHPAYYLDFVSDCVPKISYAPSIGISDIPLEYVSDFKKYLSDFRAISVREKNGVDLIRNYAGRESKWVLDPTMLLDGERWSEITRDGIYKRPYIFCYLFGKQDYYRDAIEYLQKETGYDVVIVPFSKRDLAKDYHQIYKAGPVEFISLIKNAEYVLTDSFHATVFSILFSKSFYTLLRNNRGEANGMNSRIYSLLSMVNKQERCIEQENVKDFKISPIDDYENVHKTLDSLRRESILFLKEALEDEGK